MLGTPEDGLHVALSLRHHGVRKECKSSIQIGLTLSGSPILHRTRLRSWYCGMSILCATYASVKTCACASLVGIFTWNAGCLECDIQMLAHR